MHISCIFEIPQNLVANYTPMPPIGPLSLQNAPPCQICTADADDCVGTRKSFAPTISIPVGGGSSEKVLWSVSKLMLVEGFAQLQLLRTI